MTFKPKSYLTVTLAGLTLFTAAIAPISSVKVATLFNQDGVGVVPTDKDPKNPLTRGWFLETLKPGDSVERSADVMNNSDQEAVVEIRAKDSEQTGEGSFSFVDNSTQDKLVGTWIKLSADKVTIPAKRMTPVKFTITVPKDAKPGEYAGVIAVQVAPKQTDGAVRFVSRVGARVYVTVPGELNTGLKVNDFSFVTPASKDYTQFVGSTVTQPFDDMYLNLSLNNIGNIFSKTRGKVEITKPNGEKLSQDFDRDFAPFSNEVVAKLNARAKWEVGTYKATFSFDNVPVIGTNKDGVKDISANKSVQTEFTMTQAILDQMKKDKSNQDEARRKATTAPANNGSNRLEIRNDLPQATQEQKKEDNSQMTIIYAMGGVIVALILAIAGYFGYKYYSKKKGAKAEPKAADKK